MSEAFDLGAIANGAEFSDPIEPGSETTIEEKVLNDSEGRSRAFDFVARANRDRNNKNAAKEKKQKEPVKLPPRRRGSLVKPLEEIYVSIGMGVMAFDQPCGIAITNSATRCAEALDQLAYENDAVRRVILRLITTSAWGGVILAHSPIFMAIAAHHVPGAKNVIGKVMAAKVPGEAEDYLKNQPPAAA